MTQAPRLPAELDELLEALCEDRLSADERSRLEQLVLSSPDAVWKYLTYMDLHGTLFWDAAGAGSPVPLSSHEMPVYDPPVESPRLTAPSATRPTATRRNVPQLLAVISACLALMIVGIWQVSRLSPRTVATTFKPKPNETIGIVGTNHVRRSGPRTYGPPISLTQADPVPLDPPAKDTATVSAVPDVAPDLSPRISNQEIVSRINHDIQTRWAALDIHPSARADDSEWLRRVYLDLIGRIPTIAEAQAFLGDSQESKREELVERLLSDSTYVRNFATKWTNLLIGRSSNPQVDRDAFQKFLRLSLAANRPWNQIVADLISAEGNNTETGATNFLIAHLNNDATPATAVVSRLFLGRQMQCNQCHNNPFDESKQLAFWEMNSFFQQTAAVSRQRRDPRTGRLSYVHTELVTQDAGGPTYFETQSGLMRVAYPRFNDVSVDSSPETNRRHELAQLMTYGEQPQLAAAFVNRMWQHFFGSGFTRCVDDMGTHQPVSHPELLAALSEQFIRSGYDMKQLVRWICQSEPYHLSSRFSDTNQNDDPSMGELPSFSRMYVRSMTAEQTYDSFLTATKAHQVGAVDWEQAEKTRQQWLQQFVVAFNTDENDETTTFDGSIGNALSLMNGPLINKALDISAGSLLGEIVRGKSSDSEKIRLLCLAAWSRPPEARELSSMKKQIHETAISRSSRGNPHEAFQDLFWALLNSNEFALVR